MTVLYTNAQSINSKLDELKVTSQDLNPDIILLTEAWCNSTIENASLTIENYKLETDLRRDRSDTANGIGGGLLVYSKQDIKILPCDKFQHSSFNQFCSFSVVTTGEKLNIVLIYRPPSSGETNLLELSEILRAVDENTVLIGDFNLPGIDWQNEQSKDARGKLLLEAAMEGGLQQIVDFPTHTKGNILDLIMTNCSEKIIEVSDAGRLGKSDHCILKMIVDFQPTSQCRQGSRYNWSRADIDTMQSDMTRVHWRETLQGRTIESAWTLFKDTLSQTVEKNVPKCGIRTQLRNPWMTRDILRLIRRKRRKWREVKFSKRPEELEEYRALEKETAKKIRNAKRKLEKDLAAGSDKNNRKFAKYIKSKTKSKTTVGPLLSKDKKLITGDKEIAEELNKFFSSVFTQEDLLNIPEPDAEAINRAMEPVFVTQQQIRNKIRKLRKDAAPGPDGITPSILQRLEESVVVPLEIIFNMAIESGDSPQDWKIANVTPIFKKGTKGDPGNYRPVSLTSVPCKIFESIVKDRVMSHLLDNNLIRNSQHGFMPGRSCATNLVEFMDFVTRSVDEGKPVDIFYLDFAKAFDKVPRKRLVKKMVAKGLEPAVVNWIENWLTGRTQHVNIQGEKSESCDVDSGVPQGTVLGPTLFTIYIDDLEVDMEELKLDVKLVKFADDTKGGKVVTSIEDRDKLQQALNCLCDWAEKWGMSFNLSKCKIMHVGLHNPQYDYYMRGTKLGTTDEERDIGVLVTKNLKPSAQCSQAAGRAMSVLGQLRRNFHYRDRHTFLKLYKQYVRPHLEFSSPAWSPWLQGDKYTLEKVQEKAIKMVAGLRGSTYEEKCAELGLKTLEERRGGQDMALVHKFLTERTGTDLFRLTAAQGRARTRQAAGEHGLAVQFSRTDARKYSFAVRAVENWNKLSEDVKTSQNSKVFKNRLKKL